MKNVICLAVAVLALAPAAQAVDFILEDSQHLNVITSYGNGVLLDFSTVDVLEGGYIQNAYVNDEATLNVHHYRYATSGTNINYVYAYSNSSAVVSGGEVGNFEVYGTSIVDISGGSVKNVLNAYDNSTVNLSVGSVHNISPRDTSTVNISGGSLNFLTAGGTSTVNFSGGILNYPLEAYDSSKVNLSGGSVHSLSACENSISTIYGYDIRVLPGSTMSVVDDEVIGTGLLTGKWLDGTSWVIPINRNDATATILLIHESLPVCPEYPTMDFNRDCKVDLQDFAIFCQSWLECNLEPQSACWE